MNRAFAASVLLTLLVPCGAGASLLITEISYDRAGSDDGYEWVEIHNTESADVTLSALSFFEGGVKHRVSTFDATVLAAGGYAIIADEPERFRTEYPSFAGMLLDSSFSLSNAGETLTLYKGSSVVHEISYTKAMGGNGDGHTLNLVGGQLFPRKPTPGGSASLETFTPSPQKTTVAMQANTAETTSNPAATEDMPNNVEPVVYNLDTKHSNTWIWVVLLSGAVLCVGAAFIVYRRKPLGGVAIVELGSDFD